eukprot:CAMPEP_0182445706 /NCGR_PEP_ID=MMETSP1172-20130603/3741_1 /TAXON_ID=708627 /ORGANISM="Timspurckia oligopyrenoides, Strain CCMP3278" /LENGTH=554 /DNA_ID=CAMNT_0024641521 /DNA_START=255 /DNA_END=1919 /DNA_ORIENTATION=+
MACIYFLDEIELDMKSLSLSSNSTVMTTLNAFLNESKLHLKQIHTESIQEIITKTEQWYAQCFHTQTHHNTRFARALLLSKQPVKRALSSSNAVLRDGIRIGVILVLFLWLLWDIFVDNYTLSSPFVLVSETGAFRLYRGLGCFLLVDWNWIVCCFIWDKYRVNFTFLLYSPSIKVSQKLRDTSNNTIVYLISVILYYKVLLGGVLSNTLRPGFFPTLALSFSILRAVFPWSNTHLWFYNSMFFSFLSFLPFFPVTFLVSFFTDWMSSLVRPISDLLCGFCYVYHFISNPHSSDIDLTDECFNINTFQHIILPIISILPLFLRFIQSLKQYISTKSKFPSLLNALKYAVSMITVLFGIFHSFASSNQSMFRVLWLSMFTFNSLFSYCWDILVDWKLCNMKYSFLRERLMYPSDTFYYASIAFNLIGRFIWLLTLIPLQQSDGNQDIFPWDINGWKKVVISPTFLMICEIIRRSIWSLLRVENEHQVNDYGFRLFDYVPMRFESIEESNSGVETDQQLKDNGNEWKSNLRTACELCIMAALLFYLCIVVIKYDPK